MRAINDKVIEHLEGGAIEGVKHLRAFLSYEGENPRYYQRAKAGGVLVASYVKAIATATNRMAVEQATERMKELGPVRQAR